ncbi:HAD family hydrolase [Lacisediminihabitans changchengi]|uniref:Hydrolase n=1 Tax=Lacisediminihabitans changchengi TaxID=2787634 RepID=A0A934SM44_9MICO|nr:HAD family hydrolase [Lacisediminihabitans changchengi]MBK4347487.1 hydrolase [Lacisediminihabitans changchengi]
MNAAAPEPNRLLFVFDMDDVLYDYDVPGRMAALTELTGFSEAELRERWWHAEGEHAAEAGRFADADDYLAAFIEAIGVPITEEQWVAIRGGAMTPWPDSIAAVERAAELGDVTLLTNNGPMTARHIRSMASELVPVFGDHLLTSADYRARKPTAEVFEAVLDRYHRRPEDVFFADDLQVNVDGATAVGITAHLFTDAASLRAAIEDFARARSTTQH